MVLHRRRRRCPPARISSSFFIPCAFSSFFCVSRCVRIGVLFALCSLEHQLPCLAQFYYRWTSFILERIGARFHEVNCQRWARSSFAKLTLPGRCKSLTVSVLSSVGVQFTAGSRELIRQVAHIPVFNNRLYEENLNGGRLCPAPFGPLDTRLVPCPDCSNSVFRAFRQRQGSALRVRNR